MQINSPLKRLAVHSTVTCASQATVYAKCVVKTYADVNKDVCKEEFRLFQKCLREAMKRSK